MRGDTRHIDDQYTSHLGDRTDVHTNNDHRCHHLETHNIGDIAQRCLQRLSRSCIECEDIILPNGVHGNFNYSAQPNVRFSSEHNGSLSYRRIHGNITRYKTPNTIDENCLQTDAPSQVRLCSAQDTLPGANATGIPLPLSHLSGVRLDDHADGTTDARHHSAHNIDQTELECNRSPGKESSLPDSRLSDRYLADESDTSLDASLSSGISALSPDTPFSRRTDDNALEATTPCVDAHALKPPSSRPSGFCYSHTPTPTETQSSLDFARSRSHLTLDVTTDNADLRRTVSYNLGQFDRVAEMLRSNPSVDAGMKPQQCSPSSSASGCYLVRSGSSIDQQGPVISPNPDFPRNIYNGPIRGVALSDSFSSSSTITPENVQCRPTDFTP